MPKLHFQGRVARFQHAVALLKLFGALQSYLEWACSDEQTPARRTIELHNLGLPHYHVFHTHGRLYVSDHHDNFTSVFKPGGVWKGEEEGGWDGKIG